MREELRLVVHARRKSPPLGSAGRPDIIGNPQRPFTRKRTQEGQRAAVRNAEPAEAYGTVPGDLVRSLLATEPEARPTALVVAQKLLALSGKNNWTLQAPAQPETDWGAVLAFGVVAAGVVALLKSK